MGQTSDLTPSLSCGCTSDVPDAHSLVKRGGRYQVLCEVELCTHHIVVVTCQNTKQAGSGTKGERWGRGKMGQEKGGGGGGGGGEEERGREERRGGGGREEEGEERGVLHVDLCHRSSGIYKVVIFSA